MPADARLITSGKGPSDHEAVQNGHRLYRRHILSRIQGDEAQKSANIRVSVSNARLVNC
jgi:hypothetical protein